MLRFVMMVVMMMMMMMFIKMFTLFIIQLLALSVTSCEYKLRKKLMPVTRLTAVEEK